MGRDGGAGVMCVRVCFFGRRSFPFMPEHFYGVVERVGWADYCRKRLRFLWGEGVGVRVRRGAALAEA